MDSDSPPRKKLKQARLPFQILSHKDSSPETKSSVSRKRQLSEDSVEDIVVKVGKKSEESKENVTVVTPIPEVTDNGNESADADVKTEDESLPVEKESVKLQEASTLQTLMKSTLANLFEKKVFDINADVGACDCGCEEDDSGEEALEEYLEHCKKRKLSPSSTEKKPRPKSKRKSEHKGESKQSSPSKKSSPARSSSPSQASKASSPSKSSKASSPSKVSKASSPSKTSKASSPSKASKASSLSKASKASSPSETSCSSKALSLSQASSPSKQSSSNRKKIVNGTAKTDSKAENLTYEEANEVVSESRSGPASKQSPASKSGILSKKAFDMFAKWRKNPIDLPQKNDDSAVKKEPKNEKLEPKENESNPDETSKSSDVTDQKRNTADDIEDVEEDLKQNVEAVSEGKKTPKNMKAETSSPSDSHKALREEECDVIKDDVKEVEKKGGKGKDIVDSPKEVEFEIIELSNLEQWTPQKEMKDSTASTKSDQDNSESSTVVDHDKASLTLTPTGLNKTPQRRLTPKQIERQKEIARKQEEKEKQRLERENEKKRLKHEKEEHKRKEREEKDEQRRREKEEKERKRQADLELKNEEKKKKELFKAEEKRKKDEDKRKAEEEEERRKAKASAMFTSFFVPKVTKAEREDLAPATTTVQNFMPFEVKADMRMAPQVRHTITKSQKQCLDEALRHSTLPKDSLYLHILRSGETAPKLTLKTWPLGETKDDDDICVLECDETGVLISDMKKVEKMRAKFLQFDENHRPAYHGTWRKKSVLVTGRRPFGQEKILDYEVDSADEWEEEEPGESVDGSEDERDKESEDEYEVDNSVFVPHGYLSDDEGDGDENEEILSPETQKAKLKLLGEEFEAQMKSKTSALKPIIIVLTAALQASSCSIRYQKLLERRAVWREDEGPISLSQFSNESDCDGLALNSESSCVTFSSGPGAKKKIISEEAIPALITLVHGNPNKRVFLTNEFSAFLGKSQSWQAEKGDTNPSGHKGAPECSEQPLRPSTPSAGSNPLVTKWPGLPPASRISISNKIKELATWGPCPEEGPMYGRQCWYVAEELRVKYGVVDLKLPNTLWYYTLKPKVLNHHNSPIAILKSSSASSADPRALITKFTKVMTPEEKKRQWESMKSSAPNTPSSSQPVSSKGSAGKITAFTQQVKTPGSADSKTKTSENLVVTPTSNQPQARKRVQLLVSVPRGQQIASSSHCSLLSKFEASASPQAQPATPSTSQPVVSTSASLKTASSNASNSKDDDCILLD